jgi:hypothetical protein
MYVGSPCIFTWLVTAVLIMTVLIPFSFPAIVTWLESEASWRCSDCFGGWWCRLQPIRTVKWRWEKAWLLKYVTRQAVWENGQNNHVTCLHMYNVSCKWLEINFMWSLATIARTVWAENFHSSSCYLLLNSVPKILSPVNNFPSEDWDLADIYFAVTISASRSSKLQTQMDSICDALYMFNVGHTHS